MTIELNEETRATVISCCAILAVAAVCISGCAIVEHNQTQREDNKVKAGLVQHTEPYSHTTVWTKP